MESEVPTESPWLPCHLSWEMNLFSIFFNMIEITAYECVIFFLRPKVFRRMYSCAFLIIRYYRRKLRKININNSTSVV